MKIAFELEFPDEQAADAFRWLQNLPAGWAARWKQRRIKPPVASSPASQPSLSETEQNQLLHEVFGSWKSEESGDEMVRRIYADRRDQPREVNL